MTLMASGFGSLMMYAVGPHVTYTSLAVYGLVMAAIFGVFFYFVPESPYYYYKKGKSKEAKEAVQKLRAYKTIGKLEEELAEIEVSYIH